MRETRVLTVDPTQPDSAVLATAADVLRAGGRVAFPTETVYGLGADATNPAAVAGIFTAKGRPATDPLIVHLAAATDLERVTDHVPPLAAALAAQFWPGPLTLILRRGAAIPPNVTAGTDTVAVRVPAHPVARALIAAAGVPIAAPKIGGHCTASPVPASIAADPPAEPFRAGAQLVEIIV